LLTPKLVTVPREGYRLSKFREDVQAGLTVAIVALPPSMAIAIGSGVTSDLVCIPPSPEALPGFGAWRQPFSDWWTSRRVHRVVGLTAAPATASMA